MRFSFPHATRVFQFTPLREGRQRKLREVGRQGNISIHAPPRGATAEQVRHLAKKLISIHAPPRGATPHISSQPPPRRGFQFTPLREGRQMGIESSSASLYFNSRPSARGDLAQRGRKRQRVISIHAPPRGATQLGIPTVPCIRLISIHAPPRGATRGTYHRSFPALFQFTPLREGRRNQAKFPRPAGIFQFTPLREGRRSNCKVLRHFCDFNSRPSARGDEEISDKMGALWNISIHAPPRGATRR